jgi:hypothetical protein
MTRDEMKAKILEGLYEDLMPDPPKPQPKPKLEADVLPFPPILSEQELARRQRLVDQSWERTLAAQRDLEAEARERCHRGPGDPDWESLRLILSGGNGNERSCKRTRR